MNFISKKFDDLTPSELYEILKARTQVFLLEQNIICQDMDDVDYECLHCFLTEGRSVIGCLRAYYYEGEPDTVKIGRVLTTTHGQGHGKLLFDESLKAIKRVLPCKALVVSAQKQAQGYYEKCGFEVVSGEYLEEGIVHVKMRMLL